MTQLYPERADARDAWILAQRGARNASNPRRAYAALIETEPDASGSLVKVATVFLTNRECPWRCVMCDLWKNTGEEPTPPGAIPEQIDAAIAQLGAEAQPSHIKLYNSGSFFDRGAIPEQDWPNIADRLRAFDRVVVECHPALINEKVLRFRDMLSGQLEVAMGLETAHPEILEKLNKRMTLELFRRSADFLKENQIALRVFVLVQPPFMNPGEALDWAKRSVDFGFDCDASVVSLIPTRFGNGALEALALAGQFSPPSLATLEASLDYGISLGRGRVFADTWDLEKFSECFACFANRRARLEAMNIEQNLFPRIACQNC